MIVAPRTWQIAGGFPLGPSDGGDVGPTVAFEGGFVARADSRHLLVASLTDGEVMDHVLARWQRVEALALAPGGEGCVTTVLPGPASAWCDVALGRPDGTIACGCLGSMVPGHTIDRQRTAAPALHLAFPEPGTVVAAYDDGTIRWWNTRTQSCERTIRVLGTPRALDPTGESVLTEFSGSLAVYDARTGAVIARSPVDRWSRVALVAGRLAIAEGRMGRAGGGVRVLAVAGDLLFEHPRDHAGAVTLDSLGGRVAWAEAGVVNIHALADGHRVAHDVADLNGAAHVLAFALDGSWIACGGDNAVAVLRTADGAYRTFPEITCCGGALAVSSNGHIARAQSHERWVWVLDPLRNEARALYGHRGRTTAVAWSPDGSTLASGGADGSICLFDPISGVRHAILGVLPDGTTAAW